MGAQPEIQEMIRKEMMPWARDRYNWEKMVDLWEYKAGVRDSYPWDYPEVMTEEDYVNW